MANPIFATDFSGGPATDGLGATRLLALIAAATQASATGTSGSNGGILIPASDYVAYSYYGVTNNIQTATYKSGGSGGTTVATLTFTYVGGGAANDDNVASITKS
jgi:hypothetical protein